MTNFLSTSSNDIRTSARGKGIDSACIVSSEVADNPRDNIRSIQKVPLCLGVVVIVIL
jgi:hypothetical protein